MLHGGTSPHRRSGGTSSPWATGLAALSIIAALVIALAAALGCGQGAGGSETAGAIHLAEQDWQGQVVTTAVAQILLEQQMGHAVATRFAPSDSEELFIALESGDIHFACCNWPSYSAPYIDEYLGGEKPRVQRMGPSGIIGRTGWYVPSYVVRGDPQRGIAAAAPDLRAVADLNRRQSLFAAAETGGRGRLIDITPDWNTRSQERLQALGIDFQTVFAGSESAALAQLDAAYRRGEPFLTFLWEPHWAHAKYDLVRLEMPPWTPECYPAGPRYDCGYPTDVVAKLAWPGLKRRFPEAYEFLSRFQMTNEQQNEIVLNVTQNGLSARQAAQRWVDDNEPVWRAWIPH